MVRNSEDSGADQGKLLYRIIPPNWYAALRARRARAKSKRRGERELHLLPLLVPRDRLAVDVGANRGVYSYFLSKIAPKVVAFEPIPSMVDFLERANFQGVEVRCQAASDHNGKATFSVPIDPQGRRQYNGGQFDPGDAEVENFEVETIKLDDAGLEDVGFLKIDVEGHEPAVLRGATKLIERCQPVVMLESLEIYNTGQCEAIDMMEKLGYSAMFYDGDTLLPLASAKIDLLGRNFIFFPSKPTGGKPGGFIR